MPVNSFKYLKHDIFYCLFLLFTSCKLHTENTSLSEKRPYAFRLQPAIGANYQYKISNELDMKLEINGKPVARRNKTNITVSYAVGKDSSGDLLFTNSYQQLKIYTKNDDEELVLDADNAVSSTNPVEKMLGILKNTKIVTSINKNAEVRIVSGYDELTKNVIQELKADDASIQARVKDQLAQFIEKGIVESNLNQLLSILPGSAVHIGDQWKLHSRQNEELGLNADAVLTLQDVSDGLAAITSSGTIKSDTSLTTIIGQMANGNLTGKQEGEYKIEIASGMLLSCKVLATVNGVIQVMGKDIRVKVETSNSMNGKKR